MPFYVDERVIVPRSFIGELLMTALAEDNALTGDPEAISRASSTSAPAAVRSPFSPRASFPTPRSTPSTCRPSALAVARRNVEEHGFADRVAAAYGAICSQPLKGERYDLILANPPYVDAEAVAAFPPEYAAEPPHGARRRRGRARHRAADPAPTRRRI